MTNNSRTVGLNQSGIGGETGYASGCCDADKFSSGRREKRQSGSGPYARAARTLPFQHNLSARNRDMARARSETESCLQLDSSVGGSTLRERSALKGIRNVKQPGAQNCVRIRGIHVIENVTGIHSKR